MVNSCMENCMVNTSWRVADVCALVCVTRRSLTRTHVSLLPMSTRCWWWTRKRRGLQPRYDTHTHAHMHSRTHTY